MGISAADYGILTGAKGMASAPAENSRGRDDLELAEKLATIALSSPLVRRLSSEVLRYVARAGTVVRAECGAVIETRGTRALGALLVLRGHLGAEMATQTSGQTLATYGPGEVCATEPLVKSTPVLTRLRAHTSAEVLAIPFGVARILAARDARVAELFEERCVRTNVEALLRSVSSLRGDMHALTTSLGPDAGFVEVPAGECLIEEGEVSSSVYVLASGSVDIAVPHPRAGFEDVRRDQAGTLLGRCSLLGRRERAAIWTARESLLLRVPRVQLADRLEAGAVQLVLPHRADATASATPEPSSQRGAA